MKKEYTVKQAQEIAIIWFNKCMKARTDRSNLIDANNKLKLFAIFGFITGLVMLISAIIIAVQYEKLQKDFYNTQYSYAVVCQNNKQLKEKTISNYLIGKTEYIDIELDQNNDYKITLTDLVIVSRKGC